MQKVILDTSVWVDFFKGALSEKNKGALVTLFESEQIVVPFSVRHELLIGCNNQKEYDFINRKLSIFESLSLKEKDYAQLPIFGYNLRKKGLLAKYTDLVIAYLAHENDLFICSQDKYFKKLDNIRLINTLSLTD